MGKNMYLIIRTCAWDGYCYADHYNGVCIEEENAKEIVKKKQKQENRRANKKSEEADEFSYRVIEVLDFDKVEKEGNDARNKAMNDLKEWMNKHTSCVPDGPYGPLEFLYFHDDVNIYKDIPKCPETMKSFDSDKKSLTFEKKDISYGGSGEDEDGNKNNDDRKGEK